MLLIYSIKIYFAYPAPVEAAITASKIFNRKKEGEVEVPIGKGKRKNRYTASAVRQYICPD
ncbi:MAG: hypothetical protein CSA81_13510 [Acidobacteria bacterium]|nr:MAG: hypothetical protein CSA81_13510 [Acidobacteriota bacterium]